MKNHLSFTSIKTFKSCPLQFSLRKKHGDLSNEAKTAGSERHKIIANALPDPAALPEKFGGPKLRRFIESVFPVGVTAVENKFSIDLMGHEIIGFIDAYLIKPDKNSAVIVDWKGHRSAFVDEDQLKLYAYALAQEFEVEYFECYFYYVLADFPERRIYTRAEIMEFGDTLFDTAVEISSSTFEPKTGPHCYNCSYVDKCPSAKKFEIQPITSNDQAAEYASKLYAVEAFVDDAKAKLKSYMLDNDIEEIQVTEEERYYVAYASPSIKTGKIKKEKAEKVPKAKKESVKETAAVVDKSQIAAPVEIQHFNDNGELVEPGKSINSVETTTEEIPFPDSEEPAAEPEKPKRKPRESTEERIKRLKEAAEAKKGDANNA
jgi:CRISPR/Cas system-associated exonuclease Cas4 (RecB family)